jgi:hypothetical protein
MKHVLAINYNWRADQVRGDVVSVHSTHELAEAALRRHGHCDKLTIAEASDACRRGDNIRRIRVAFEA